MRLFPTILLASSLLLTPAGAAPDQAFVVTGERYAPAFDRTNPDREHFVEFTRPGETVKAWTTLFVLHGYPVDYRMPKAAAGCGGRNAGSTGPLTCKPMPSRADTRCAGPWAI